MIMGKDNMNWNPRNDANCEAVQPITQAERERQVAIKFIAWLATEGYVNTDKLDNQEKWNDTKQHYDIFPLKELFDIYVTSDAFKEIQPSEPEAKSTPNGMILKELFTFIDDGCVEVNFYGNDGNDNQEKVDGKELLKKYIIEASQPVNEGWIKVEDQLPEDDEIVLTYHKRGQSLCEARHGGLWSSQINWIGDYDVSPVSHWRQIPSPPKPEKL